MDLGNVDTREVQAFVGTTVECVVRKTDCHFSMREVYFEIDFAKWSRNGNKRALQQLPRDLYY